MSNSDSKQSRADYDQFPKGVDRVVIGDDLMHIETSRRLSTLHHITCISERGAGTGVGHYSLFTA